MPAVDVRLVDVVKRFGEATAVDHIDLEVEDGEFFSLLGPSGCGKTTTLRMIGGFEEPTSGLIELRTTDPSTGQSALKDVTWLPPYERDVNTVFQNYALFPHLTIEDNVAFGLRRKKVKSDEIKSRVADMLKLVELPGFEKRKPTQISGGQAQRVALARALINRPSVLLLDEPLGALDLKLRKQMQVELKRIQQEVGITFIYVTHDQEEAMTMSDRIAVMNRGKYEQLADPESLYERPTTRFVAGFLGVSNLLPGTVDGGADSYTVVRMADDTRVRVPRSGAADGTKVEAGVRPEKIRMRDAREDGPAGHNTLLGTIRDASYLGVSTSYIVETRAGARLTVYEQNVERATRSELWAAGEEVRLSWQPEHTFVLRSPEGAEPGGASEGSQPVATPTVPPAPEPADIGA
ncbi:MAG TPA: ABC transporter ATP-binding protein [Patescibacteria group bacterium]|nr:ABC transporter ATP-binding protein [Patescibacteria group bacterium]